MPDVASRVPEVSTPWDPDVARFVETARRQLPFDGLTLALFHGKVPQPDEVLFNTGIPPAAVKKWCETGLENLPLFRAAKKTGHAVAPAGAASESAESLSVPAAAEVMLHVLPESMSEPRWWFLLVTNARRPFTPMEQRVAGLLLRQWQARFNHFQKPVIGRLIVGHDNRLIHADPWTQIQLLENPAVLPHIMDTLRVVTKQRWNQLADSNVYDFAIELGGRPFWIRFQRHNLNGHAEGARWYLELYPLEANELPIVGGVNDDRVARAIGYIHDTFQKAPSLAEMARAVHVSPFHFHRLFTGSLGISPKHYLQQKQLQVAKWLLRTTREPIGSVAVKSGFASHGHFSSTFQRLVGKSPSQYRDESE